MLTSFVTASLMTDARTTSKPRHHTTPNHVRCNRPSCLAGAVALAKIPPPPLPHLPPIYKDEENGNNNNNANNNDADDDAADGRGWPLMLDEDPDRVDKKNIKNRDGDGDGDGDGSDDGGGGKSSFWTSVATVGAGVLGVAATLRWQQHQRGNNGTDSVAAASVDADGGNTNAAGSESKAAKKRKRKKPC